MKKLLAVLAVLLNLSAMAAVAQRGPVIDVQLHSYTEVPPGRSIGGAFLGDDGLLEHSVDSLRALDDPRLDPYIITWKPPASPLPSTPGWVRQEDRTPSRRISASRSDDRRYPSR